MQDRSLARRTIAGQRSGGPIFIRRCEVAAATLQRRVPALSQMFTWWAPADWRRRIFDGGSPAPRHHVVIPYSAEADGTEWIHTRGMRKFGRPDLSIHKVGPDHKEAIVDLCNRFIEFLAFGGVVEDGQRVRMKSLPTGMQCLRRENDDDPDFNNEHIEIVWPGSAVVTRSLR